MVHRPGYVWENGQWRPETPEEARRPREIPLTADATGSDGGTDGGGGDKPDDDAKPGGGGKPAPKPDASGGAGTAPRDDGKNPTFNRFLDRLAPREGGISRRPASDDPGGPTNKGVSQGLLDQLNRQHPEWGLPEKSENMTDAQIRGIYRSEFFDKPKIQKVEDISGLRDHAPQLPEQLFDAGVLHGSKRAGQWLQQSLDEKLGTVLRVPDAKGNPTYDGNVGPNTRAAIAEAVNQGKIRDVNDSMVDMRIRFMQNQPNFPENPGWVRRANGFRTAK